MIKIAKKITCPVCGEILLLIYENEEAKIPTNLNCSGCTSLGFDFIMEIAALEGLVVD